MQHSERNDNCNAMRDEAKRELQERRERQQQLEDAADQYMENLEQRSNDGQA